MARFRAYNSDSSDEDDEEQILEQQKALQHVPGDAEYSDEEDSEDESSSSSPSSSEMDEDELVVAPNALVEDEDGEYRYGHELNNAKSLSAPNRDPTIIPRAHTVGIDAQRMHVMQTSLFRMPEEAAALKAMSKPARTSLRPLDQHLNRKHSRDSDGDGLRLESRERASFAYDIEPPSHRPSRKYARVESSASVVKETEDALTDAGLAFGRSFRVGWGPGGMMAHTGALTSPTSSSKVSSNSSTVYITKTPIHPLLDTTASSPSTILSSKLLQHQLSSSPIESDDDGVPFANPDPSSLHFASFASLFPPTDCSYEANLFRLGHALFDSIDLRLGSKVSIDIRNRVSLVARKAALSAWLEQVVASTVESDLRSNPAANSVGIAFTLLTGNQLEKACEAAMEGGNMKLATLISQAGGDFEFREDLREQLDIWREEKIDVHVDEHIRKIYALLAGIVGEVVECSKGTGVEKEKPKDVDVVQSLDWKRVFGLHLWYSEPVDAPISQVYEAYHHLTTGSGLGRKVAKPIPWYEEKEKGGFPISSTGGNGESRWNLPKSSDIQDGMFSLIRLHSDPACSLSQILKPLSFGPSPVDYAIPWHLYIILSRCMGVRDLGDRGDPNVKSKPKPNGIHGADMDHVDEGEEVSGHSPSADLLTSSYALQLEQLGMIQEAVFVLLHIEGSAGRRKAIKDLLARSADKLDEWMTRGVVGSLKIPMKWVQEAKAIYAVNTGHLYAAFELYLAAGLYNQAHEIAVIELAPDAVLRHDYELLKEIFERFGRYQVDSWYVRGKTFLDYVKVMTRLPVLLEEESPDAIPDASNAQEMEDLIRSVPKLVGLLPDVLTSRTDIRHKVALHEMTSRLVGMVDRAKPEVVSQVQPHLMDEATKLNHLRASAASRFVKSIRVD
ncbi:hypothetical protein K435DRAFT_746502 [Dendrothele bispora CBS 962.96]|uniref:Nuclear pore complex protein NUP96 C-terminal domain-containing protein n=1 Tax=Dendrothele bispora (strain CBS 962.96) TaxID=1314807 RepID=A0A4S8MPE4_DENBC|nr:hypothetical protein K435DRAFT_746502 [Dendrothele bispora CBS 962.96]